MVKRMLMEEISLSELGRYNDDCPLFIRFKESSERKHAIIDREFGVGVFKDYIYAFHDDDLKFRAKVDDIDYIFAFEEVEDFDE